MVLFTFFFHAASTSRLLSPNSSKFQLRSLSPRWTVADSGPQLAVNCSNCCSSGRDAEQQPRGCFAQHASMVRARLRLTRLRPGALVVTRRSGWSCLTWGFSLSLELPSPRLSLSLSSFSSLSHSFLRFISHAAKLLLSFPFSLFLSFFLFLSFLFLCFFFISQNSK